MSSSFFSLRSVVVGITLFCLAYWLGATFGVPSVQFENGNFNTAETSETGTLPTDVRTDTNVQSIESSGTEEGGGIAGAMTPSQHALLESFGINPETFVITPEVISCAEAALGAARVAEIQNGATPNLIEAGKLLSCYKAE